MISQLFKSDVPKQYRTNFIHLYFDIGWFGILSGSAVNFLSIYATRLGANGSQIGLLTAVGAVVSLMLAIPSGQWIQKRPISKAIFWSSVASRIGYLLWVPLPWLFGNTGQIAALIILTLLMAIPLTPLSVGFNALFAASVPDEYRAHVAGIRNVVLSISYIISSLVSGYLLDHFAFPIGYQIVFLIGFFGAAMSSVHLFFIRPLASDVNPPLSEPKPVPAPKEAAPRSNFFTAIRADIWSGDFKKVLLVLLGFHLSQYIALPLFPLYQVHNLNLTDDQIGISSALFYLTVLIGSTQLRRIVHRIGHKQVTAIGVVGMGLYPFLLALSRTAFHFYALSALGGISFSLVGGAYANYMLEHIPANDRPPYLAWYNVILNASILVGSLVGPVIANEVGLIPALFIFAAARTLAGLALWKWG